MRIILLALFSVIRCYSALAQQPPQLPPPPFNPCESPCFGVAWTPLPPMQVVTNSGACTVTVVIEVVTCHPWGTYYRVGSITSTCPISAYPVMNVVDVAVREAIKFELADEPDGTVRTLIEPRCYRTFRCNCSSSSSYYTYDQCGNDCCMTWFRKDRNTVTCTSEITVGQTQTEYYGCQYDPTAVSCGASSECTVSDMTLCRNSHCSTFNEDTIVAPR